METFWRKSCEPKPTLIDTNTKRSGSSGMDFENYFAMDSLLANSDLEEEEEVFLKAQDLRKHRIHRSVGERTTNLVPPLAAIEEGETFVLNDEHRDVVAGNGKCRRRSSL